MEIARYKGIEKYTVTDALTAAENCTLPPCIHICTKENPRDAFRDMYWAIHRAPINAAIWMPPFALIPEKLRTDVRALQERPPETNPFQRIRFEIQTENEDIDCVNRSNLQQAFQREAFTQNDRPTLNHWLNASGDVYHGFRTAFENTIMDLNFDPKNDGRTSGATALDLHADKCNEDDAYMTINGKRMAKYGLRTLWSQADRGVILTDVRDIDKAKDIWDIHFSNPYPTLYSTPAWAVTMLAHLGWSHTPNIHGSPLNSGRPLKRLLWDARFDITPEPEPVLAMP